MSRLLPIVSPCRPTLRMNSRSPRGFSLPFEESLMEVQRVLVCGPRRVQFPIDESTLDFSVNAKPGAQVKICPQEISLKEVTVPRGGNVSNAANSKSLGPELDLPAQR